ncbi:MAG TPA: response regulator transcription factor, partial [Lacipirellulaceae bacterium]|nr:response regulator transcription factor [Lacipirellulaceae bacterium]
KILRSCCASPEPTFPRRPWKPGPLGRPLTVPFTLHHPDEPLPGPRPTVFWLLANALDCDALVPWCQSRVPSAQTRGAYSLDGGLARCEALRPQLLVVDPALADSATTRCMAALQGELVGHLLVLDALPREGRLVDLLAEPRASYMTRAAGAEQLVQAISTILEDGTRVIDPAMAPRVRPVHRGLEFIDQAGDGSVALLSARERQVMRLLAQGKTVRECAAILELAQSTIDNHRARLMKKLGIHKAAELTCRAVRDGLIAL